MATKVVETEACESVCKTLVRDCFGFGLVLLGTLFTVSLPARCDVLSIPFDLVVPKTIVFNTAHSIGASGETISGWLVATTTPIDVPSWADMVLVVPGTSLEISKSDVAGVFGIVFLDYWTPAALHTAESAPLLPGDVLTEGLHPENIDIFSSELEMSERIVRWHDTGFLYSGSVYWPSRDYTGTATIDFVFGIGHEVARYPVFATFISDPNDPSLTNITSIQRVSSVFEPDSDLPLAPPAIPEPGSDLLLGTVVLCGFGLARIAPSSRRKQHTVTH